MSKYTGTPAYAANDPRNHGVHDVGHGGRMIVGPSMTFHPFVVHEGQPEPAVPPLAATALRPLPDNHDDPASAWWLPVPSREFYTRVLVSDQVRAELGNAARMKAAEAGSRVTAANVALAEHQYLAPRADFHAERAARRAATASAARAREVCELCGVSSSTTRAVASSPGLGLGVDLGTRRHCHDCIVLLPLLRSAGEPVDGNGTTRAEAILLALNPTAAREGAASTQTEAPSAEQPQVRPTGLFGRRRS
jgi:hypothetical protein